MVVVQGNYLFRINFLLVGQGCDVDILFDLMPEKMLKLEIELSLKSLV